MELLERSLNIVFIYDLYMFGHSYVDIKYCSIIINIK